MWARTQIALALARAHNANFVPVLRFYVAVTRAAVKESSLARLRLTQLSPARAHLTLSTKFTKFEAVKEVYTGSVPGGCDNLEPTSLKLDLFHL